MRQPQELLVHLDVVAKVHAVGLLKLPQPTNPLKVVRNAVSQFENVRPAFQPRLKVGHHLVPISFVQLAFQDDKHPLLASHALDELLHFLPQFLANASHVCTSCLLWASRHGTPVPCARDTTLNAPAAICNSILLIRRS